MSYQAVVRDAAGKLVTDASVSIRITILQGSETGTPVYTEVQGPTTNENGLLTIEVGAGKTDDDFSNIDWANGPHFIKCEIDPTGSETYSIVSVSQLLSVPYALLAKTTEESAIMENQIAQLQEQLMSSGLLVKDNDGNIYKTVQIGDQVWMAENLKTTTFNEGTPITLIESDKDWVTDTDGAYCWYHNDIKNKDIYGAIYNFYAAGTGKLCPKGWHVPTKDEWIALGTTLGGDVNAGGLLKEAGLEHWKSPNTDATNESGFTALPGGVRMTNGAFNFIWENTYWWSSTESGTYAYGSYVTYDSAALNSGTLSAKEGGMSIRCIKDSK